MSVTAPSTTASAAASTTASTTAEVLSRSTYRGTLAPAAPVRIVHLGLGAFHRAHQAWYTARADTAGEWGIAAFTGRSSTAADELAPQDGLFSVIERSAQGDDAEVVSSIVEAVRGDDLPRFVELLAAPTTAIVTLTITEAGYRLTPDGLPNRADAAVEADIAWLAENLGSGAPASGDPTTSLGRLVLGLDARRRAGGAAVAIVPCDNLPDNGAFVARGLTALARTVDPELAGWIESTVSFVSTSVDRITPRTTPDDLVVAERLIGVHDRAAVVTEPFSDWVLSGDFPAGRPRWEDAGARIVDEIEPFENRKLWLLNGAHSLLAYTGLARGHGTVAQAMADPTCRGWVEEFWDAACAHLPAEGLDLPAYRAALLERFDNARIAHQLEQISAEGVAKLRVRTVPTILAERAVGRSGDAGVRVISAWAALVLAGRPLLDAEADAITTAKSANDPLQELVRLIDPRLLDDDVLRDAFARSR